MADSYKCRPSDILELEDGYERFCFDEACYYIIQMIKDKKKPRFKDSSEESANDTLKKNKR